ncbi:VOC family protein [uncultured Streptomyces sp.]|uniref:VOC family protein n=1 Tax=uncultured Streptomyces sp. TaxID=174707 RepID=UPI00260A6D50|nr:VOC family protein [uncultured Streptomyces sp.]
MLDPTFVPGAPNWIDLGTPDLDGATAFYREVFGWDLVPGGPETGGYGMYTLDGRTVAGVMTVTEEQAGPSWSVYFQTPDVDATAKAVSSAGGNVPFPPMDVLDYGRMGGFTDPAGTYFGTWQPGTNTGLGVTQLPGSFIWCELYVPDTGAAKTFYQAVFGWETEDSAFPGGSYTMVRPAGTAADGDDAYFGGLVGLDEVKSEAAAGPHWLPYFHADDVDRVLGDAVRLGGTVTLGPMEVDEVGTMANVTDPYGASFAVIKPAPMGEG